MDSSDGTEREAPLGTGRRDPESRNPRVGDTLGGRFVLREVLGFGGTGTVFSALDTAVGQKVAVKLLHPDLRDERTRERLRREVRASRSGHPNAVAVYDLHEANGHVFLSMELVEGTSLKEHIAKAGRLEVEEVVTIGRRVASALSHLHAQGIVHRDVKPGNILLARNGEVKLCDMGLARPLEEGVTVTATEMIVGTPAYMAPEQGTGGDLTQATDIYGLGLTLFKSLSGSVPLKSETAVSTLTLRQRERPPSVRHERPESPRWLARLLRRMLEPDPKERPRASVVERSLENEVFRPRLSRRALATAALVLLGVGGAVAVGSRILQRDTVKFEVVESDIRGIDSAGKPTWSYAVPAPATHVERADINGDGRNEIVVAGRPTTNRNARDEEALKSYLTVLEETGELVTRLVPENAIGNWRFSFRMDISAIPYLIDVDGDGWTEIVLLCQHVRFYPAIVMIYWPRWDIWERLFTHSGNIYAMAAASRNGSPGLAFLAVNNLLAMVPVFGEVELLPPGSRKSTRRPSIGLNSPPGGRLSDSTLGSWRAYVPLTSRSRSPGTTQTIVIDNQSTERRVLIEPNAFALDPLFNPVPGANRGIDLRDLRSKFMDAMFLLVPGRGAITPDGVNQLIENTRTSAGVLLAESPYDVILAVLGGRALAAAGDLEAGIGLLESVARRIPNEDLLYRLAHLEALADDIEGAKSTLNQLIDSGLSPRSRFDAPILMLQLAIRSRDQENALSSLGFIVQRDMTPENRKTLMASFMARTRLWWDQTNDADCEVRSVDLDADGDAVGCLARWRRGTTRADDVQALRKSIDLNSDGADLGRVALAAALLSSGRPLDALVELDRLIAEIEPYSRYDFFSHETHDLARAMRVLALESTGNIEQARGDAERLEKELDGTLLPGILVSEVLQRIGN